MTKQKHKNVRIFCICGQKMQITPDMYGRAAKCVSCRQKIFIPESGDLGDGEKVLYLREHPDLLRKTGVYKRDIQQKDIPAHSEAVNKSSSRSRKRNGKTGNPDIKKISPEVVDASMPANWAMSEDEYPTLDLSSSEDSDSPNNSFNNSNRHSLYSAKKIVPLDTCAPLMRWYSYLHELNRLRSESHSSEEAASLDASEQILGEIHAKLIAILKKEEASNRKHLDAIEGELGRLSVSLRVGDITLKNYFTFIHELRIQREVLTRHDYNLKHWQQDEDPFSSFGLIKLQLDSLNAETFDFSIPVPIRIATDKPLFIFYEESLRESFHSRITHEKKIEEWKILLSEKRVPLSVAKQGVAETEYNLARANCQISFFRQRLEFLNQDCENDLNALKSYEQDIKERIERKQLPIREQRQILEEISKEKNRQAVIKEHVAAVFKANSIEDISTSVFPKSLSSNVSNTSMFFTLQSLSLSLASVLLFLFFVLRSMDDKDILIAAAILPSLLLLIHVLFCWLMYHKASLPLTFFFWGMELVVLLVSLYYFQVHDAPSASEVHSLVTYLYAFLLFSGAGMIGVGNGLGISSHIRNVYDKPMFLVSLLMASMILSGCLASFSFISLMNTETVSANSITHKIQFEGDVRNDSFHTSPKPQIPAPSSSSAIIALPQSKDNQVDSASSLPEDEVSVPTSTVLPLPAGKEDESVSQIPVQFTLVGVVHGEGLPPRFRASLLFPDGSDQNLSLRLGDAILGNWKAREYNADSKKLIISDGTQLLIVQAGEKVDITNYIGPVSDPLQ